MPAARLLWPTEVENPRAVVLVLHGGRSRGRGAVRPWQGAVLRMAPFASAVARAGRGEIAVASLRYAVRGWNGVEASPLADTRLALEQVAARYPGVPVGLLGHSMGGRVALHLADDPRIPAIVALAPWVERPDRPRSHPGLHLLVMHGSLDRMTSAKASRSMATAIEGLGADVTYERVTGDTHAMLRRAEHWHERSAGYLAQHLLTGTGTDTGTGTGTPEREVSAPREC
jgi:alpha-beta hydrolase superfamily lysophospholipase